ncbi:MFS polyamine transporter [Lyophyllum atratum]|nr:MFS polyamine transporter [Lyophyllum atratum]
MYSTPSSTTPTVLGDGLVVKSLEDLNESIDPRISLGDRPTASQLDETLTRQLSNLVWPPPAGDEAPSPSPREKAGTPDGDEPIYIEFEEGDKRNPINFSLRRKWAITTLACISTVFAASTASTYNMGLSSMTRDLNCTQFQGLIGLSVYALGFGVVPLVTASFSEEFGRQPLYIGSFLGFFLMYMMVALSKNIQTVILARLLQGAFGSTGSTMVGGTVADIWLPHDRGLPMTMFTVASIAGTGLGPVWSGWVEMNPRLEWRWIQWIQMILCSGLLISIPIVMKETRTSVLLMRIVKKLRRKTGNSRYRARVEDERASLRTLIVISCTRPVYLMLTEPIVLFFSIWIGFAWGVMYCLITSVTGVFTTLHGFNIGEVGTLYCTMAVAALLGVMTNLYQDRLYHKQFAARGHEARLHTACFAALLLPIAMFIYAWTAYAHIHWIAGAIGITIYMWATFIIYSAVFSYLADCYGPFASSALAGQSLFRNLMAMVFPLFTRQMFRALGYPWGNTIFALIAVLMIPIPFALFFFGPAIRRKSKFSRVVAESEKLAAHR